MYQCSECRKRIGLMADIEGQPELFKCPYTGAVADKQEPIRRKPIRNRRRDVGAGV